MSISAISPGCFGSQPNRLRVCSLDADAFMPANTVNRVKWSAASSDVLLITAMHDDPSHRWTLQSLAERAGMSRTVFTPKFKETAGVSPMDYLTRWRMLPAGDRLTNSDAPVSLIAQSLGYESESAFSTAFKRVMGCLPRQYSRGRGAVADAYSDRDAPVAA